jgi:hypothetical protein
MYTNLNFSGGAIGSCEVLCDDLTPGVLASCREFLFRSAMYSSTHNLTGNAGTPNAEQETMATHRSTGFYYVSSYKWSSGVIVIMILNVLTVISLFHRYWQLGRNVSMSALELAKALGAPLMRGGDSNQEATGLLEGYDHNRVRYGVVLGSDEEFRSQSHNGEILKQPRSSSSISLAQTRSKSSKDGLVEITKAGEWEMEMVGGIIMHQRLEIAEEAKVKRTVQWVKYSS